MTPMRKTINRSSETITWIFLPCYQLLGINFNIPTSRQLRIHHSTKAQKLSRQRPDRGNIQANALQSSPNSLEGTRRKWLLQLSFGAVESRVNVPGANAASSTSLASTGRSLVSATNDVAQIHHGPKNQR